MNDKLKIISGYILSLIIVMCLAIYIELNYPFKGFYILAALMILISLLGDYFIYLIAKKLVERETEEIIIKENEKLLKENEMFYKFCDIQQTNIRHYYHDISNHLITLKLLKEANKKEEYNKYLKYIKDEYSKVIKEDSTNNVLLDILIEYYLKEGISINIINSKEDVDYIEIIDILNILKEKNKEIDVDLKNNNIICKNINIDKNRYNKYTFKELSND